MVTPAMLITDDDRGLRETLREVFEPRGFRTLLAADGQQALEIVQQHAIHVVLLDNHMPRLNGLETLRELQRWQRRQSVLLPCILMSARMDEVLAAAARSADAFSVLSKPVDVVKLTDVVDQAMRRVHNWPDPSSK